MTEHEEKKSTYLLRVPDEVASLIRGLHPLIKSQIRTASQTILEDPHCGKSLKEELHNLRSYRVKKYRIIYRVVCKNMELEVVAVGPRRNIYKETFKIISKEETKK